MRTPEEDKIYYSVILHFLYLRRIIELDRNKEIYKKIINDYNSLKNMIDEYFQKRYEITNKNSDEFKKLTTWVSKNYPRLIDMLILYNFIKLTSQNSLKRKNETKINKLKVFITNNKNELYLHDVANRMIFKKCEDISKKSKDLTLYFDIEEIYYNLVNQNEFNNTIEKLDNLLHCSLQFGVLINQFCFIEEISLKKLYFNPSIDFNLVPFFNYKILKEINQYDTALDQETLAINKIELKTNYQNKNTSKEIDNYTSIYNFFVNNKIDDNNVFFSKLYCKNFLYRFKINEFKNRIIGLIYYDQSLSFNKNKKSIMKELFQEKIVLITKNHCVDKGCKQCEHEQTCYKALTRLCSETKKNIEKYVVVR